MNKTAKVNTAADRLRTLNFDRYFESKFLQSDSVNRAVMLWQILNDKKCRDGPEV